MKKKNNSTGSLKGFLLLIALTGGILYFYQHKHLPTAADTGKQKVEEIIEKTKEKLPNLSIGSPQNDIKPVSTDISSHLEIPVSLKKRNEVKLERTAYTVSYNNFYKTPNWVAWELTRQETTGKEERKNKFLPDPDLPEPRVEHADYTRSGYDRGHMAPAADMKWSKKAMQESFYMSNICPQNSKLNRDDWGDLEEACRQWAKKYGTVYIACGPIYDRAKPERIGRHQVAVPDRFFKAVLIYNRKNPIAMGFLFDNKAGHKKLEKYMVTIDSIEKITDLDFFSRLPDDTEQKIESIVPALP